MCIYQQLKGLTPHSEVTELLLDLLESLISQKTTNTSFMDLFLPTGDIPTYSFKDYTVNLNLSYKAYYQLHCYLDGGAITHHLLFSKYLIFASLHTLLHSPEALKSQ